MVFQLLDAHIDSEHSNFRIRGDGRPINVKNMNDSLLIMKNYVDR